MYRRGYPHLGAVCIFKVSIFWAPLSSWMGQADSSVAEWALGLQV